MRVFFPITLNLLDRRCVVIGEDREAIEKEAGLREAGAQVVWIKDAGSLRDEQVIDAFFVISTPQDAALSARLRALADRHRFLLCCIDQPRFGFVAMAAIAKAGPVRVAISTAGLAPKVGKVLKNALQRVMDAKFVGFIERLATQREQVQREYPLPDQSVTRRNRMLAAADGFEAEVTLGYPEWYEKEVLDSASERH